MATRKWKTPEITPDLWDIGKSYPCYFMELLDLARRMVQFLDHPDPAEMSYLKMSIQECCSKILSDREFSTFLERQRRIRILFLRKRGYKVKDLARLFGITERRVYQLCAPPDQLSKEPRGFSGKVDFSGGQSTVRK